MSAPIPSPSLDSALTDAVPRLRRASRPRTRPLEAVVLEVDGVLARPVPTRARRAKATDDADALETCHDAAAALRRWRRGELRCAAVCRGADGHRRLHGAGVRELVDVVLDDRAAAELGLGDEVEVLHAAVARLGVLPHDAVALCSTAAGVTAAQRAGYGLVIGIDRCGHDHRLALTEAGAHRVTHSPFELRFPRRLPSALEERASIAAWRGDRSIAVFLDYDGTLAPIVDDPAAAVLSPAMRATLEALAERWPVAILSGRDRADLEARVGVSDLVIAGSHGLDIAGRGLRRVPPEAERAIPELERAHAWLRERVGHVPGVLLERKRLALAVHHRRVADPAAVADVERAVDAALVGTHLRRREGKRVIEVVPDVDWDQGRALRWILDAMGLDPLRTFPVHVGDDEPDEDAFAALAGMGAGIRVGSPVTDSLADWCVQGPDEVAELLAWLEQSPAI